MLAVACCGFDDPEGLERLIKSCWKYVDLFFYIDGSYIGYNPGNIEYIEKETDYILKDYPNVIKIEAYDLFEYQKRQIYLDLCKEWCIDTLIIVDTDEYFHPDSDWTAFTEERKQVCNDKEHLYNLINYTEFDRILLPLNQPRLIKNPNQVHYLNGHHYQLAINGTDDILVAKTTLYSIKLCHDPHLRTQERRDEHDVYIKWLERYEAGKMLNESPKEKENRLLSVWSGN
jgi:hypothetical protein